MGVRSGQRGSVGPLGNARPWVVSILDRGGRVEALNILFHSQ